MPALEVDTTVDCWDMFNPEQHKLSCCHCLDCTDKDRCLLFSSPASVCFDNLQDSSVKNTKQSKLYPKSPPYFKRYWKQWQATDWPIFSFIELQSQLKIQIEILHTRFVKIQLKYNQTKHWNLISGDGGLLCDNKALRARIGIWDFGFCLARAWQ